MVDPAIWVALITTVPATMAALNSRKGSNTATEINDKLDDHIKNQTIHRRAR